MSDGKTDRLISEVLARMRETDISLGPCVEGPALTRFEHRNGIILPSGYREFLLRVGNGGDGPGHGLDKFNTEATFEQIGGMFPLTASWLWDDDPAADAAQIDACAGGWVKLGTEGCGMDWVLIVGGSERGQVWNVEAQGAQPCAPARGFLDWYLLWLNWRRAGGGNSERSWWDTVWADLARE